MSTAKPIPVPRPESEEYWRGCREGALRVQRCDACGHRQLPPRPFCTGCSSPGVSWVDASGSGTVASWTIVEFPVSPAFADDVPFVLALVDLDEGPRMMAGLKGCTADDVEIGARVSVVFEKRSDEIHVPYFELA